MHADTPYARSSTRLAPLREEAQKLLADYQRRQKEAEAEAASMIETARIDAERFKAEQIAKIEDFVARRTKLADQKIAQAEASAIAEVGPRLRTPPSRPPGRSCRTSRASSIANLTSAALNESAPSSTEHPAIDIRRKGARKAALSFRGARASCSSFRSKTTDREGEGMPV